MQDYEVWFDPTQEQLGLNGPISHEKLLSAGYEHIVKDRDSVEGCRIDLYLKAEKQRWYLALICGEAKVASALVFTSRHLGDVVREFQTIAGVL